MVWPTATRTEYFYGRKMDEALKIACGIFAFLCEIVF